MKKREPKPQMPSNPAQDRKPQLIGWAVAIVLHALLLLGFAFLNFGWRYDIPEWVEMEFMSVNPRGVKPAGAMPQKSLTPPAPKKNQARKLINLPERRMLEDELPKLKAENKPELFPEENPVEVLKQNFSQDRPELDLPRTVAGKQGKEVARAENLHMGDKQVQTPAPDLGKGVAVPFLIEGEAAERTVLHRVIPEYPSNLSREAVVKISFVVLPSGVVVRAVPILKGDAVLER
ncbi:MAG: hypothetical protein D6814_17240, partial [Calditrichaeota bacterium]